MCGGGLALQRSTFALRARKPARLRRRRRARSPEQQAVLRAAVCWERIDGHFVAALDEPHDALFVDACGRIGGGDENGTPPRHVTAGQQGDACARCGGATQHRSGERSARMCRDDNVPDPESDILEARPLERHTAGEVRKRGDDGVVDEHVVLWQADVDGESRRSRIGVEQQEYLSEQAVTGAEVDHTPSRGGCKPRTYARGHLPGLVQLLAWQAVDGADGAPECIEQAVTWIMARVRRRQLVARAWAVRGFLAGLYGGGASAGRGCTRSKRITKPHPGRLHPAPRSSACGDSGQSSERGSDDGGRGMRCCPVIQTAARRRGSLLRSSTMLSHDSAGSCRARAHASAAVTSIESTGIRTQCQSAPSTIDEHRNANNSPLFARRCPSSGAST